MVWDVFDKASEKLPKRLRGKTSPASGSGREGPTFGTEGVPEGAAAHGDFSLDEIFVAVWGREADPLVHLVLLFHLSGRERGNWVLGKQVEAYLHAGGIVRHD